MISRQQIYYGPPRPTVTKRAGKNADQVSRLTRTILRAPFTVDVWRRTGYGLLCLPVAIVCFLLTIPFLLVGTPLIIVAGVGLVVSLLALWSSRQLASLERTRALRLLRQPIAPPEQSAVAGHLARRWWTRIRTPTTWLTLAYMVTNLPLSLLVSFLCLYPWLQTVYSLTYPIVQWHTTFSDQAWGGPSWLGAVAVHTLPGIAMLFAAPWIVRGATTVHLRWVRLLLVARDR